MLVINKTINKPGTYSKVVVVVVILSGMSFNPKPEHRTGWKSLNIVYSDEPVKIHRFETATSDRVRIWITSCIPEPAISEFMVYNEKRWWDRK